MDASPDISASTSASETETLSGASDDLYRIDGHQTIQFRKAEKKLSNVFQEKLACVKFLK
ncbi:hypothetical protein T4E_4156 [Trichinella pseudospiralis]|uniref:Uncharacterized protein n=1 Tax=Trichinella pseudospiralis TaxID=6337 RepID=A0A0V0YHU6_TRIPS|nr:hypothetical protein T4E_4156 [Trichinella pseudospiralis]